MKTIKRMFEHLQIANQRILNHLRATGAESDEARKLFSHLLLAEQVWLYRLTNRESSQIPLWSVLALDQCEELLQDNQTLFDKLLSSLSNVELEKVISYQNSRGQFFQSTVGDILTHVALHGQYHRGQINKKLREQGKEPISVDYISFVRNEY